MVTRRRSTGERGATTMRDGNGDGNDGNGARDTGTWKVGELARRTGLTVRTLHHYDRIGLLRASGHTPSRHRLYGAADVARLQQILSLRQLGLALDQIRELLDRPDTSPLRVVELHLERVRAQLAHQQQLYRQLEALAARLRSAEGASAEEFIRMTEAITMYEKLYEKYYTPEQLAQLAERGRELGPERMREVEAEWPRLMAEVRAEMARGTSPADPRVRALARRWMALVQEFTGGDPGIERSLRNLYANESTVAGMDTGAMGGMTDYLREAL